MERQTLPVTSEGCDSEHLAQDYFGKYLSMWVEMCASCEPGRAASPSDPEILIL